MLFTSNFYVTGTSFSDLLWKEWTWWRVSRVLVLSLANPAGKSW